MKQLNYFFYLQNAIGLTLREKKYWGCIQTITESEGEDKSTSRMLFIMKSQGAKVTLILT
jgi:hypothetical protein